MVGRGAFYTIRKTIAYTVAHAVPELVPSFANLVFDLPIMLPALCILVIDLLTEQMPAVSFVYDEQEKTVRGAAARPRPRLGGSCRLSNPPLNLPHTHTRRSCWILPATSRRSASLTRR